MENLPNAIYSLPRLKILNIEENLFTENVLKTIKSNLSQLNQKGQKIDLFHDRQGHRQMVKKLRAIKNIDSMQPDVYAKYCSNAVYENPFAIKYVNPAKLGKNLYATICLAAIRKSCLNLENVNTEALDKKHYFKLCMEAAKNPEIGSVLNSIKSELLTDNEYLQVCIQAVLNNRSNDLINNFKGGSFQKRFSDEIFKQICWVAMLRNPKA